MMRLTSERKKEISVIDYYLKEATFEQRRHFWSYVVSLLVGAGISGLWLRKRARTYEWFFIYCYAAKQY